MKTVLFDLDGTLSDPKLGITTAVAYALSKFGIEVRDLDTLIPFIGPPLFESFQVQYAMSEEESKQAILYYREYFSSKGIFENEVYEGISSLLAKLQRCGIACIVATSKPEEYAKRIMEHFQLIPYVSDVCGASMDTSRIAKGDVIAYALEKNNVSVQDAVMVGDKKQDVLGAKQNHMQSIGVLYGYGSYEELEKAGADEIVRTVEELKLSLIKRINS